MSGRASCGSSSSSTRRARPRPQTRSPFEYSVSRHEAFMTTTIRFHQYGPPGVLTVEDDQVDLPGPGQVRLRQEAIGVNYIDTAFRTGAFPLPLPGVTGVEAAGVVDAIGSDVKGVKKGDRMAYFLSPGSYAEE